MLATITWPPPADPDVTQVRVYRASSENGPFEAVPSTVERPNPFPAKAEDGTWITSYTDTDAEETSWYAVSFLGSLGHESIPSDPIKPGLSYSSQVAWIIKRLRRRIKDDTKGSYKFFSDYLLELVSDAVDELEAVRPKGYSVTNGEVVDSGHPVALSVYEKTLIAIQAHILFAQALKAKADRDNFSLRKGSLTFDARNQAPDHEATLRRLEAELHRILSQEKIKGLEGVRVE